MTTKQKPTSLWKAIKEAEIQDDVDEVLAMSDAELDAYITANGGDPERIRADGEALARQLDADRDRLAWQEEAAKGLALAQARAAEVRARPKEKLSRAELLARIESARNDPRYAPISIMFRNRKPGAATEEELQDILDEITILRERADAEEKDKP